VNEVTAHFVPSWRFAITVMNWKRSHYFFCHADFNCVVSRVDNRLASDNAALRREACYHGLRLIERKKCGEENEQVAHRM